MTLSLDNPYWAELAKEHRQWLLPDIEFGEVRLDRDGGRFYVFWGGCRGD